MASAASRTRGADEPCVVVVGVHGVTLWRERESAGQVPQLRGKLASGPDGLRPERRLPLDRPRREKPAIAFAAMLEPGCPHRDLRSPRRSRRTQQQSRLQELPALGQARPNDKGGTGMRREQPVQIQHLRMHSRVRSGPRAQEGVQCAAEEICNVIGRDGLDVVRRPSGVRETCQKTIRVGSQVGRNTEPQCPRLAMSGLPCR